MRADAKNKAIVLGLGVNGLGVCRSLGRAGVSVIGIYTRPGPGVFSRYCKALQFPSLDEFQEFLLRLLRVCAAEVLPPVLIATSDAYVQFLSNFRQELQEVALFNIPEQGLLRVILSKQDIQRLALQHRVQSPETYQIEGIDSLNILIPDMQLPCLFKPMDHRLVLPDGVKCYLLKTKEELQKFVRSTQFDLSLGVFQEFVASGDNYSYSCSGYVDRHQRLQSIFCVRKIRHYYPDFGIMCYGESVYEETVLSISKKFLKDIHFTGVFDIDFLQDRGGKGLYLIELNPRSFYYNSFSSYCGVDVSLQMYRDLTWMPGPGAFLQALDGRGDFQEGVRWMDFERDLGAFLRKRARAECGMGAWLWSLILVRSWPIFDLWDLGPFCSSLTGLWKKGMVKISKWWKARNGQHC